jgi:hypothetical protein
VIDLGWQTARRDRVVALGFAYIYLVGVRSWVSVALSWRWMYAHD